MKKVLVEIEVYEVGDMVPADAVWLTTDGLRVYNGDSKRTSGQVPAVSISRAAVDNALANAAVKVPPRPDLEETYSKTHHDLQTAESRLRTVLKQLGLMQMGTYLTGQELYAAVIEAISSGKIKSEAETLTELGEAYRKGFEEAKNSSSPTEAWKLGGALEELLETLGVHIPAPDKLVETAEEFCKGRPDSPLFGNVSYEDMAQTVLDLRTAVLGLLQKLGHNDLDTLMPYKLIETISELTESYEAPEEIEVKAGPCTIPDGNWWTLNYDGRSDGLNQEESAKTELELSSGEYAVRITKAQLAAIENLKAEKSKPTILEQHKKFAAELRRFPELNDAQVAELAARMFPSE